MHIYEYFMSSSFLSLLKTFLCVGKPLKLCFYCRHHQQHGLQPPPLPEGALQLFQLAAGEFSHSLLA